MQRLFFIRLGRLDKAGGRKRVYDLVDDRAIQLDTFVVRIAHAKKGVGITPAPVNEVTKP